MKPINFYLVTDTHYFENELGAGGEAFEKNMVTEQYFVKESGEPRLTALMFHSLT